MTDSSKLAKIQQWRYLLARRFVQIGVLFLFVGGAMWNWPVLKGNLSASQLFDTIPLSDPFATLQIIFAGQSLKSSVLWGAVIVAGIYAFIGGRVFCSWVCPVNMITDLAGWLRDRLHIKGVYHVSRRFRMVALVLTLLLSLLTGVAAFEWISPIGVFHRELIFGLGIGWVVILGIFLFDLLLVRHGWCGHLCPLGAFYSVLGRFRIWKIRFDVDRCDKCNKCHQICPEPHVLNLTELKQKGWVVSGDCTNCLRCPPVCPQKALTSSVQSPLESFKIFHHKEVV